VGYARRRCDESCFGPGFDSPRLHLAAGRVGKRRLGPHPFFTLRAAPPAYATALGVMSNGLTGEMATHDPGKEAARDRAERAGDPASQPLKIGRSEIRFGTASWTDPTLTRSGMFYPAGADSAEERLRYYASRFSMVEVDSSYYALPAKRSAELWVERTPAHFTFDIKAYALLTGQPSEPNRLPTDLHDALPETLKRKPRIYGKELPRDLFDVVWERFLDAVQPLHSSGKLGSVLLQFPRWFLPGPESREYILDARNRLGDIGHAVELRNARWFSERNSERTLRFFTDHDIPFVMVDEPQGLASSVPPLVAVTSPRLAVVRFHGRRSDLWERRGVPTVERFRYLYDRAELGEWVPKVMEIARKARQTHVIMNNCYGNYGTTNAMELARMVREAESPVVAGG